MKRVCVFVAVGLFVLFVWRTTMKWLRIMSCVQGLLFVFSIWFSPFN